MTLAFIIISVLTLAGAVAAVCFRNTVHCVLALILCFSGLAAHYLRLNAQFIGLAQLLIYIGAVAILIVFAILLTREKDAAPGLKWSRMWKPGILIAATMLCVLTAVAWRESHAALPMQASSLATSSVSEIGQALMSRYVLPLEILALLLTAAMIGAATLAMRHEGDQKEPPQ